MYSRATREYEVHWVRIKQSSSAGVTLRANNAWLIMSLSNLGCRIDKGLW